MLSERGAEVVGVEPNNVALEILRLKSQLRNLDPEAFQDGVAEALPYSENHFDFVFCYTVLEHVQDVEKSLDEMIRVCKPGGVVFIETPDYRFPYEDHYKVLLIPFAPKWIQSWYLRIRKRPVSFLKSINFLTAPKLDRMLWKRNVVTIRISEPSLLRWSQKPYLRIRIMYWFANTFAVNKNQFISYLVI